MGVTDTLSRFLASSIRGAAALRRRERASRVSGVLSDSWERELGVGQDWMPSSYGEYYPRSSVVYSALKVRQEAVARVPLRVTRVDRGGDRKAVGPSHPAQSLLDFPNPFWTRGDLWRATETYLGLWGSAFWGLERDDLGRVVELWPLRSDRMRVVPDPQSYVKGFVYVGRGRQLISYLPEDVVGCATSTRWTSTQASRRWRRRGCRPTWGWRRCGRATAAWSTTAAPDC